MSRKGKCKIQIRYIEDDKKRADALYKRRRGLMKKAHELSVICGFKISIFATDFNRACFSFCNDPRLKINIEDVFKDLNKPIWMTNFNEVEYPFTSVRGEIKEKILFGKKLGKVKNSKATEDTGLESSNDHSTDFLSKRSIPGSTLQDGESIAQQSVYSYKKRLKIEKEASLHNPHGDELEVDGRRMLNTASVFVNFRSDLYRQHIVPENIDDYLCLSMKSIVRRITSDPVLSSFYQNADPDFAEKILEVNRHLFEKMSWEKFFFDRLILRNFLCFYFDPKDYLPFSNVKKIPLDQMMKMIDNIEDYHVDKLCEVMLLIIFDRIKPESDFDLKAETEKIDFCMKLYSLKRVHTKKRLVAMHYQGGKVNIWKQVKNFTKTSSNKKEVVKEMFKEISKKLFLSHIAMEDCWLTLTLNEMIGIRQLNKVGNNFFESIPEDDMKKFIVMLSDGDPSKLPIVMEVVVMEKKRNEIINSTRLSLFMKSAGGESGSVAGDNHSVTSDFSFNFLERSSNSNSMSFL